MIVDFMIIGAQKCGTTTFFDILKRHPDLSACREKEPHFFSKTPNWRKNLGWYHSLFEEEEGRLLFEASTTYTFHPFFNKEIWLDIFDYNPEMKFIYLVRNPLDRIISGYRHSYERGYLKTNLSQALRGSSMVLDVTRSMRAVVKGALLLL